MTDKIADIEQQKLLAKLTEEEPVKRPLMREAWQVFKVAYILGITGFACFETITRKSSERNAGRSKEAYESHMEKCRGEPPKEWTDIPAFNAKMYQKMAGMEGEAVELKIEKDGRVSFRVP